MLKVSLSVLRPQSNQSGPPCAWEGVCYHPSLTVYSAAENLIRVLEAGVFTEKWTQKPCLCHSVLVFPSRSCYLWSKYSAACRFYCHSIQDTFCRAV